MRLSSAGIISYAGLEHSALWDAARRAFALAEDYVPVRFRGFLPLFPAELIVDMPFDGTDFSSDPTEYHRRLYAESPFLYAGDNASRCLSSDGTFIDGRSITVDPVWADHFPQYAPFMGEKLCIHRIGGGCQAAAVPESIYPRGGGVLDAAEREMRVTAQCERFAEYLLTRLEEDRAEVERAYLSITGLSPVMISQSDLGSAMQETVILRDLEQEDDSAPHTVPSPQYAPYRCACDLFAPAPLTRSTSRLLQLHFSGDKRLGDLWLPYQEASQYMHKKRHTLDVRALCEGFQIAPVCDTETRGGCYPDRVRVVVVRDRTLPLMTADTLNNPAYGSGMSPLGMPNKLVYLPGSHQLLHQKRLGEEPCPVTCINTRVEEAEYLQMRRMAEVQEYKGRLIDAMHRREEALRQLRPGSAASQRARWLLDARVQRLEPLADGAPACSGYDEDLAYLRRMAEAREQNLPFQPDAQRERSIAAGWAMRHAKRGFTLNELLVRHPEEKIRSATPSAHPRMEQASNGQWFEQMNMFEKPEPNKGGTSHEPDPA